MKTLDAACMRWMQAHRTPGLAHVFRVLTWWGTGKTWGVLAGVLWILIAIGQAPMPRAPAFLRCALTAMLAWGVVSVVKRIVKRPRPHESGHEAAVRSPLGDSFPSGHAAASVAFAVSLAAVGHPWAIGVAIWAAGVTFSRFYLGVHYPTDLLGGVIFGIPCGLVVLAAKRFFVVG